MAPRACSCAAPGRLEREPRRDNYYRDLYASKDMRRIVAREHTSLLDDATRLKYENRFKQGQTRPERTERPGRHAHAGDGHRHRRPVRRAPGLAAQDSRLVPAADRPGRSADRQLRSTLPSSPAAVSNLPRLEDPLSVINGRVRPPATYLSAEEILQRQYVAHLVDCFARDENRPHPRRAEVPWRADKGSFLGDLIAFAEGGAGDHLDRFPGQFR